MKIFWALFCLVLIATALLSGCNDNYPRENMGKEMALLCVNGHLYFQKGSSYRGGIAPLFDDDDKFIRCSNGSEDRIEYDRSKVNLLK